MKSRPIAIRAPALGALSGAWICAALALGQICIGCSDSTPTETEAADIPSEQVAGSPESESERAALDAILEQIMGAEYEPAAEALEHLLIERPDWERARLYLGISLQKLKRYDFARPHLEFAASATDSFPNQVSAWYYLGWCRYNLGDADAAREAFHTHLASVPDEGDSHFGLGLIDLERGDLDAALQRFETSIELHKIAQSEKGVDRAPDIAKAHARIADVHVTRSEWSLARDQLATCVALHPPHYEAWFKLHEVFLELGEERAAAGALREYDMWKAQRRPISGNGSSGER